MDQKNGVLQQQTKTAGAMLPAKLPENVPASAPRRTASAAGIPGPANIPFSQKYLVVPTPTGKRVLAGKLERMDTKDSLDTDGTDVSPPPSPTAGGGENVTARSKTDGVRATAGVIKDPASAFTILRAEWDGRRAAHAADPFVRTWIRPYVTSDNYTNGFSIPDTTTTAGPLAIGRRDQATAGSTPTADQRLGPIIKWKKLKVRMKFWGGVYSAYNGTSITNGFIGRLQIPEHRIIVVRDKWPDLGPTVAGEIVTSITNQKATNINAILFGIANSGDTLNRCLTEIKQSPLTKGVRYEILYDRKWVPGTSLNSPAQITVTGNFLYRSWLELKEFDLPVDGMESTYAGTGASSIFTNDLQLLVVRNITPQELNPISIVDVIDTRYDLTYYQQWSDMTTASNDVQPSANTAGATAAATAK